MKKLFFLFLSIFILLNVTSYSNDDRKILIAYFSLEDIIPEGADAVAHATPAVGNTKTAAMAIQNFTKGELFKIETVQRYSVSHQESSSIAEKEMRADTRPILSSHVKNMSEYDIVYIGYPIWWYMEPMVIRSFLEEYDFSGKTVIPFCTSLGVEIQQSEENIRKLIPEAEVLQGLRLRTGRGNMVDIIYEWLKNIGMLNEGKEV